MSLGGIATCVDCVDGGGLWVTAVSGLSSCFETLPGIRYLGIVRERSGCVPGAVSELADVSSSSIEVPAVIQLPPPVDDDDDFPDGLLYLLMGWILLTLTYVAWFYHRQLMGLFRCWAREAAVDLEAGVRAAFRRRQEEVHERERRALERRFDLERQHTRQRQRLERARTAPPRPPPPPEQQGSEDEMAVHSARPKPPRPEVLPRMTKGGPFKKTKERATSANPQASAGTSAVVQPTPISAAIQPASTSAEGLQAAVQKINGVPKDAKRKSKTPERIDDEKGYRLRPRTAGQVAERAESAKRKKNE